MNAEKRVFEIPELRRYILSYYLEKEIPPPKKKFIEKVISCGKSLKRHGEFYVVFLILVVVFFILLLETLILDFQFLKLMIILY